MVNSIHYISIMEPPISNSDDFLDIDDFFDYDEEHFDNEDSEERDEDSFYRPLADY